MGIVRVEKSRDSVFKLRSTGLEEVCCYVFTKTAPLVAELPEDGELGAIISVVNTGEGGRTLAVVGSIEGPIHFSGHSQVIEFVKRGVGWTVNK